MATPQRNSNLWNIANSNTSGDVGNIDIRNNPLLAASSETSTTTGPKWLGEVGYDIASRAYDQIGQTQQAAQQGNQAVQQAAGQAGQEIGQAQSTLSNIATGLANPYTATGELDQSTVAGQLFQNQNQALQQQLPSITAGQDASAIASGGFGGLRNLTAGATARGQAVNDLAAKQAQTLAENQGHAINAAGQLGDLGNRNVQTQIEAAKFGIQSPYSGLTNYANLVGQIAPTQAQTTWNTPSQVQAQAAQQAGGQGGGRRTVFAKEGGYMGGLDYFEEGGMTDREMGYAPRSQTYVGHPDQESINKYGYTAREMDMRREMAANKRAIREKHANSGRGRLLGALEGSRDRQRDASDAHRARVLEVLENARNKRRELDGMAHGGLAYMADGGYTPGSLANRYGSNPYEYDFRDEEMMENFEDPNYDPAGYVENYGEGTDWSVLDDLGGEAEMLRALEEGSLEEEPEEVSYADTLRGILGFNKGGLAYMDPYGE